MLEITIKPREDDLWDEMNECFVPTIKIPITIKIEHSLISISKWESKYHRSYSAHGPSNKSEELNYIKFMTISSTSRDKDSDSVYCSLSEENMREINEYINDPASATCIIGSNLEDENKDPNPSGQGDVFTSELVYWLMIQYKIPVEFQKWHINKLVSLIKVCELKSRNTSDKKIPQEKTIAHYRDLNERRKATWKTKG